MDIFVLACFINKLLQIAIFSIRLFKLPKAMYDSDNFEFDFTVIMWWN